MELRLRQIVLVARDRTQIVDLLGTVLDMSPVHGSGDLSPFGLPAEAPMSKGGRSVLAQLGVENLLFAAGSDFIEVMFPTRPDGATVAFMDRRGGDTGYMLVLQTDDVDFYAARASREGVEITHRSQFPQYRDIHLHPRDCGGALLAVARHLPENTAHGAWYPAGTAWQSMPASTAVSAVTAAEMLGANPEALAHRWGRLLDRPVNQDGNRWAIELDDGTLRFGSSAAGQKDGFYGIDLRVRDRARIDDGARRANIAIEDDSMRLAGMTIRLVT